MSIIKIDMAKAKEIHKANIREASDTSAIVSKKQALRDAPAAVGISTALTVTDLKAQWNTSILGDSPYS